MVNTDRKESRALIWVRWIARIWSAPLILYTLLLVVGYSWSWITTGVADPYATNDATFVEALPPLLMLVGVVGLAIAWRRERLGAAITLAFQLITLIVLMIQRPILGSPSRLLLPYLLWLVISIPGFLFWFHSWKTRGMALNLGDA